MSPMFSGPLGCSLVALLTLSCLAGAEDSPSAAPRVGDGGGAVAVFRQADRDGDGKVSWEELQAIRPAFPEKQFKRLDKNSDGFITPSERPRPKKKSAKQPSAAGKERNQYVAKLIATHDEDKSGDVTLAEIQRDKPGFPASTFGALDRDKNGTLGAADLTAAAPTKQAKKKNPAPTAATVRGKIQKADQNKDGKLTFDEARVAFPNMTESRFKQRDRNGDGFLSREDRPSRP